MKDIDIGAGFTVKIKLTKYWEWSYLNKNDMLRGQLVL